MAGLSMLRVVSNDDMVKAEEAKIRSDMEERQNSELILGLAAHVKACWNPARIAKKPIENIMLRALICPMPCNPASFLHPHLHQFLNSMTT